MTKTNFMYYLRKVTRISRIYPQNGRSNLTILFCESTVYGTYSLKKTEFENLMQQFLEIVLIFLIFTVKETHFTLFKLKILIIKNCLKELFASGLAE